MSGSAHCRITVGAGSAGSGTLVRRGGSLGLVLTCAHLFGNATGRIIVTFTNGQRFAARLVERDRAHDLAALLIRRPDVEPIAVSDEAPDSILSACGYGIAGGPRYSRGARTVTHVGATAGLSSSVVVCHDLAVRSRIQVNVFIAFDKGHAARPSL